MGRKEAEGDEEADERVKDGATEGVAEEVECEVFDPRYRDRGGKMGCCRDSLHFFWPAEEWRKFQVWHFSSA